MYAAFRFRYTRCSDRPHPDGLDCTPGRRLRLADPAAMSSRLARSAGLISIATMASRLLGVAREMVLARIFGASAGPAMDAFNVAFRVPNLVRDLFAEGAMTAAFVPTFTRTLNNTRPRRGLASRQPRHQCAARRHGRPVARSGSSSPSRSPPHRDRRSTSSPLQLLGFDVPPQPGFAKSRASSS